MKRMMIGMMSGALMLGMATTSFAESKVGQRQQRQQQRIANGVAKGSLTAGETSHIEKQESRLNKEVRADRRANGGNLTNNEKQQINRQQNRLSKEIYVDKHNGKNQ